MILDLNSNTHYLDREPDKKEKKPSWDKASLDIIKALEGFFNCLISESEIAWGGYSPSASFKITLENGKIFFVKGMHPDQVSDGTQSLKQEINAYEHIEYLKKISPLYKGCVKSTENKWFLGIWDYIDNVQPCRPWTIDKFKSIIHLTSNMHQDIKFKDISEHISMANQTHFVSNIVKGKGGWNKFISEPDKKAKFYTLFTCEKTAEKWLKGVLPVFSELQNNAKNMNSFEGLMHFDLRSDNIIFDGNHRPYIIDWPNICFGPVIFDLISFFSSVYGEGGPNCIEALKYYEKESGVVFDKQDVLIALSCLSGYFAQNAYRQVPDELPRLRWIQTLQLHSCLWWMEQIMDIPTISNLLK